MTEVFNKFLDELSDELNSRGAKIDRLALKGKNLTVTMQNGQQIPLRNLPLPSETLMYIATRFLNPKKVAALFGRDVATLPKNLPDYEDRDDSGAAASAGTSIFAILAIIILVLLVVGAAAFFFNRNNGGGVTINNPPSQTAGASGSAAGVVRY